jgi:hypothetical protein
LEDELEAAKGNKDAGWLGKSLGAFGLAASSVPLTADRFFI